jgi:hypothetical protein
MAEPVAVWSRVVLVSTHYWRTVKKHVADFSTECHEVLIVETRLLSLAYSQLPMWKLFE